MSDYNAYRNEYDIANAFFHRQIADRENKAFEYGVIVVRNAVLIAGGGLVAIPAIAGLSSEIAVNIDVAARDGIFFAAAVIIAIVGSYIIHVNWVLHAAAWEGHWEDRQEYLVKLYLEKTPDEDLKLIPKEHYKRSIETTFWIPHILVLVYLGLISCGFYNLYSAMGIFDA